MRVIKHKNGEKSCLTIQSLREIARMRLHYRRTLETNSSVDGND